MRATRLNGSDVAVLLFRWVSERGRERERDVMWGMAQTRLLKVHFIYKFTCDVVFFIVQIENDLWDFRVERRSVQFKLQYKQSHVTSFSVNIFFPLFIFCVSLVSYALNWAITLQSSYIHQCSTLFKINKWMTVNKKFAPLE